MTANVIKTLNDETVYLDEKEQSYLSFSEIKMKVIGLINRLEA